MPEVDLIPEDFRRKQSLQKRMTVFVICYLVLLVLVGSGMTWIAHLHAQEDSLINGLKTEETSILDQQKLFEELRGKRDKLSYHLSILDSLRGGPKAQRMFVVIDRSINDSVWFTHWTFLRAGEEEPGSQLSTKTGYFTVVPKGASKQEDEPWENQIRMHIKGQALSHSALADFVSLLQDEEEVEEVKLKNTKVRPFMGKKAIKYEISVKVRSGRRD